jgi:predicted DNA-binding transcriptional regulator AlpA
MKQFLSIKETAEFLGISERTIYNGVAPKSKRPFPIKPKRIGKLVKFDVRELERFRSQI